MKLNVKPLKQKDAERGLAAIEREAASELGLEAGDFIRIEGQEAVTNARVWPGYPEDRGSGIVRIDEKIREQVNVGIDDQVEIEKTEVEPAEQITVALPQRLSIRGSIDSLIRRELSGKPISAGQNVQLPVGLAAWQGQAIPLKIVSTEPSSETVVVSDSTEVRISELPAEHFPEQPVEEKEISLTDVKEKTPPLKFIEADSEINVQQEVVEVEIELKNTGESRLDHVSAEIVFYEDEESKYHMGSRTITTSGLQPQKFWKREIKYTYDPKQDKPKSYEIILSSGK